MKLVLLTLADQANDQGVTWPSLDTLSERCDLSRQSILDQIEKLTKAGFLKVESGGGRRSNRYTVVVNAVDHKPEPVAVNAVDPSSQPGGPQQSTPLTPAVNAVDPIPNRTISDPKLNQKPDGSAAGQEHAKLIEWWVGEYPKHHGGEAYVFQGGKDGSAVKRLVASGLTPDQIKRIAVAAWQAAGGFNCSHAASLAGFAGRINEIRAELNAAKAPKQQKNGDRAEGLKAKIIEL